MLLPPGEADDCSCPGEPQAQDLPTGAHREATVPAGAHPSITLTSGNTWTP